MADYSILSAVAAPGIVRLSPMTACSSIAIPPTNWVRTTAQRMDDIVPTNVAATQLDPQYRRFLQREFTIAPEDFFNACSRADPV